MLYAKKIQTAKDFYYQVMVGRVFRIYCEVERQIVSTDEENLLISK